MKSNEFTVTKDGKEKKLFVRQPLFDDIEEAEKVQASKIACLIRENSKKKLLLRREIDEYLKKNNIWTTEDEQNIDNLQDELNSLLKKISKGGIKKSEGRELAIKVMDKRKEIFQAMNKRQVFEGATIESVAEQDRNDYLIYSCTVDSETGEKYWESFEDMKLDKLSEAYMKASKESIRVIYNVDPDFEKSLPENKWLKKYGFINDNLEYTDPKTGEKVDKNGVKLSEIEKKQEEFNFINENGEIVEETPFLEDEPVISNTE